MKFFYPTFITLCSICTFVPSMSIAGVCVVAKCNSGYYIGGSVEDSTGYTYYQNCLRCPGLPTPGGSTYYGQVAAGMNPRTECRMPSGVEFSDTTGVYEFTSACQYSY